MPEDKQRKSPFDVPGTKQWYWAMRVINIMLFIVPVYPLLETLNNIDDFEKRIGSKAPVFADYVLAVAPGVIGTIALACTCRALYRIAINFEGNSNPYTERDKKVLNWVGWVVTVLLIPVLPLWMWGQVRYDGDYDADNVLVLLLVTLTALTYVRNIYVKGEHYYKELEKGV